jgi:hypothetical protein
MKIMKGLSLLLIAAVLSINSIAQQKANIIIKANEKIANVQPTMWGVFFEDINLGADGGIYAELVKNRSFEFFKPLMGWTVKQSKFNEGSVRIMNRGKEVTSNPHFLTVSKNEASESLSISNEGFRGMGIKKGIRYDFSVMFRQQVPGLILHIALLNSLGKVIGTTELSPLSSYRIGLAKAGGKFLFN